MPIKLRDAGLMQQASRWKQSGGNDEEKLAVGVMMRYIWYPGSARLARVAGRLQVIANFHCHTAKTTSKKFVSAKCGNHHGATVRSPTRNPLSLFFLHDRHRP